MSLTLTLCYENGAVYIFACHYVAYHVVFGVFWFFLQMNALCIYTYISHLYYYVANTIYTMQNSLTSKYMQSTFPWCCSVVAVIYIKYILFINSANTCGRTIIFPIETCTHTPKQTTLTSIAQQSAVLESLLAIYRCVCDIYKNFASIGYSCSITFTDTLAQDSNRSNRVYLCMFTCIAFVYCVCVGCLLSSSRAVIAVAVCCGRAVPSLLLLKNITIFRTVKHPKQYLFVVARTRKQKFVDRLARFGVR